MICRMLQQRGRPRWGGGNHRRNNCEGELVAPRGDSPGNVDLAAPFDSIEAHIHLLQHSIDQLSQAHHLDHADHVSFFADILHNQRRIRDCQASLQRNQQHLQARMDGFETHMAHMEYHIHDAFHRPVVRENEVAHPIAENVPQ